MRAAKLHPPMKRQNVSAPHARFCHGFPNFVSHTTDTQLSAAQLAMRLRNINIRLLVLTRKEDAADHHAVETGMLSIPLVVEMAVVQLNFSQISLAGVVAAGEPIEPIPQTERVEVPKNMWSVATPLPCA